MAYRIIHACSPATQFKLEKKSFYHSKAWNYVILETMQEFTLMQLNNISILRVT